ncbi:MAG: acyl--CoA ligase [Erysipelotrichaceae bacterium]|nr:acyl--CoA ligase [Erysipelotrichaceae bacterium]
MREKKQTGYPSIDKPWLKYYNPGAEEAATKIPEGKTVWDVIEEKLLLYKDIPAIEYFGRKISRPEFIDMVYTWARAFKALGVKEDEVIPYYGPFFPDVGAMAFALNIIGACPYFLKLAISPEALHEETSDSRIAIVYSDMWQNVAGEFSKDRFEKVIFVTAADAMPSPKKQIVSLLGKLKRNKNALPIPHGGKYLRLNEAKKYSAQFSGEVRVQFVPDRAAFITSSSGTTVGGVVKGCVATNESTVGQLVMEDVAEVSYFPKNRVLNHFPPTASTSLNSLFLVPLYRGATIVMDPRVTEDDFYNQINRLKPNVVIHTGSAWQAFFTRVEKEQQQGKTFDFSFATGWIVGGEGTDIRKFQKWKHIISNARGADILVSGYGASELFSAAIGEQSFARCPFEKQIISVGIPYAGMNIGVFDQAGHELGYNQRGELWIMSKTVMKEYYKKPDLTAQTKIDGWIRTGDLAEIDENGFVYIWGRLKDTISLLDGQEVFLFDIANRIKENEYIDDVIVLSMPTKNNSYKLVAHIVWNKNLNEEEKKNCLVELNKTVEKSFPEGIRIDAYAEHEGMLPYSPTTLKKDKNKLSKQTSGYIQIINGKVYSVEFIPNGNEKYYMNIQRM